MFSRSGLSAPTWDVLLMKCNSNHKVHYVSHTCTQNFKVIFIQYFNESVHFKKDLCFSLFVFYSHSQTSRFPSCIRCISKAACTDIVFLNLMSGWNHPLPQSYFLNTLVFSLEFFSHFSFRKKRKDAHSPHDEGTSIGN